MEPNLKTKPQGPNQKTSCQKLASQVDPVLELSFPVSNDHIIASLWSVLNVDLNFRNLSHSKTDPAASVQSSLEPFETEPSF